LSSSQKSSAYWCGPQAAGACPAGPLPLAIFVRKKAPRIGSCDHRSALRLWASSSPISAISRRSRS
jgi:hypothetical protein